MGLIPTLEDLDDNHVPAAAWTWRPKVRRFGGHVVGGRCRDRKQSAGMFEMGPAGSSYEQTVVADAMGPSRHDVEQEAAAELVGRERHDLPALGTLATIILGTEGDAALVKGNQAPVGDRDRDGVARQIGEHGFRTRECGLAKTTQRFFGTGARCRRNTRPSARCSMPPKKASLPARNSRRNSVPSTRTDSRNAARDDT